MGLIGGGIFLGEGGGGGGGGAEGGGGGLTSYPRLRGQRSPRIRRYFRTGLL